MGKTGTVYGYLSVTGEPLLLDPVPNMLMLGEPDSGKSFLAKVLLRRLHAAGVGSIVFDTSGGGNYGRAAEFRGGQHYMLAANCVPDFISHLRQGTGPLALALTFSEYPILGTLGGAVAAETMRELTKTVREGVLRYRPTVLLLDEAWPFLRGPASEEMLWLARHGEDYGVVLWALGSRTEDFRTGVGRELSDAVRAVLAFPLQPPRAQVLPRELDKRGREVATAPIGTFTLQDRRYFPTPVLARLRATPEETKAARL